MNRLLALFSSKIGMERTIYDPVTVMVEATTKCSQNCPFCYRSELDIEERHIKTKTLKKTLEKFSGANKVSLIGLGEVMEHPKSEQLFELAKEKGKKLRITTNGMIIEPWLELPDEVLLSINYLNSERWDSLREIKEINDGNIMVQTVKMKQNERELQEIKEKAERVSDGWLSLEIYAVGEGLSKYHSLVENTLKSESCIEPWYSVYVTIRGDIYPCCFIGALNQVDSYRDTFEDSVVKVNPKKYRMGSLNDKNVWNNEKYRTLRRKLSQHSEERISKKYYKKVRRGKKGFPYYCDVCQKRYGVGC